MGKGRAMTDSTEEEELSLLSRLEDFLGGNDSIVYTIIGYGFVFAWIWLGVAEGYPVFTDGAVDTPSVLTLLISFSVSILIFGFVGKNHLFSSTKALAVGAGIATIGCIILLLLELNPIGAHSPAVLFMIRLTMLLVGTGAALLLGCFGSAFCCLEPKTTLVSFCFSAAVSFAVYSCISSIEPPFSFGVFCLCPVAAAALLPRTRLDLDDLLAPLSEKNVYSKGYIQLVIAFSVFFFAVGAIRAMEPVEDFANETDAGIMLFFIGAMVLFGVLYQKRMKVGVFKILKVLYTVTTIGLILAASLSPLATYHVAPNTLFYLIYILLFMLLWLLLSFVGYINEIRSSRAFSIALGVSVLAMAAGWLTGDIVYSTYGHERYFLSIALGCATTVFCTIGFSAKNFPSLTTSGEGARKLAAATEDESESGYQRHSFDELIVRIAPDYNLSKREVEVFALLARGFGTEYISSQLTVSPYTVRSHRRNIYKKLDIHSQEELLALVVELEKSQ